MDSVDRFIQLTKNIVNHIVEAGALAVRSIDKDPTWVDKVCKRNENLTPEFIHRVENVGRGKLDARLLWMSFVGSNRLRRLPISMQQKCLTEGVPVLIKTEAGWETLKVEVPNLTSAQANQAIAFDHVRTDAEQRAYLEDIASRKKFEGVQPSATPYEIKRDKVYFQACTLTRKDLLRILADMESAN